MPIDESEWEHLQSNYPTEVEKVKVFLDDNFPTAFTASELMAALSKETIILDDRGALDVNKTIESGQSGIGVDMPDVRRVFSSTQVNSLKTELQKYKLILDFLYYSKDIDRRTTEDNLAYYRA